MSDYKITLKGDVIISATENLIIAIVFVQGMAMKYMCGCPWMHFDVIKQTFV